MAGAWEQDGDHFTFDDMTAERAADDNAFVITSFGAEPDADRAFAAIRAAMAFGQIRLRVTPQTKPAIDALKGDKRIKCVPAVGTGHPELGIMAIKRA